jgi:UDP-N-acetylglucosamine 2-epimerase (non-hydrolysing)
MNKFIIIFGTRPELIKLAPIIHEFKNRNLRNRLYIVNSNQHPELVKKDFDYFRIDVDHEFRLKRDCDNLTKLNGLLMMEFHALKLKLHRSGIQIRSLIAQGDTATTYCSAMFSYYEKIPFFHVEAGLRTNDFNQPFPEEYYRKTISSLATTHFAPTLTAQQNLITECISRDSIIVTGNTVIDNLKKHISDNDITWDRPTRDGLVLITIHRRENRMYNIASICSRIIYFCENHPQKNFLWLTHPGFTIKQYIDKHPDNLTIANPVSFLEMLNLYQRTNLIITDSGGIQEEASYLGIPTLLFRTKTERIEGINSGISKYLKDEDNDLDLVMDALNMKRQRSFNTIYGDGKASKRIVDYLVKDDIN